MHYNGFFFDLDGTLINSMDGHYNSWRKILKKEFNYNLNKKEFMITEGTKLNILIKNFLSNQNIIISDLQLIKIIEMKDKDFHENNTILFYPNTIKFIKYLKSKNTKISLISAGSKKRIKKTLSNDFLNMFDCIITGDDCRIGKPNPEPYLNALNILELSADKCAALENSPLGIESAKNANLYTYGISNTLSPHDLCNADEIISDVIEIMDK